MAHQPNDAVNESGLLSVFFVSDRHPRKTIAQSVSLAGITQRTNEKQVTAQAGATAAVYEEFREKTGGRGKGGREKKKKEAVWGPCS